MPNGIEAPGRLRNILDDPFAVRSNRETTAGELLLTYDPTPGTWMYDWDNDETEDAPFAASLGFVYRHLLPAQVPVMGFLVTDGPPLPFPPSVPPLDFGKLILK